MAVVETTETKKMTWKRVSATGATPERAAWIEETIRDLPQLLTINEVAKILRLSRRSVERYIAMGRLFAARHGVGGSAPVVIPRSSLRDYLYAINGDVGL